MRFKISVLLILLGRISWASDPASLDLGKQLATQGNARGVAACMSCHGANGEGQAATGFPQLAGLDARYIAKQLHDFKSKQRINPIMAPISQGLNDQEILQVAAYYSSLQPQEIPASEIKENIFSKGQQMAQDGLWSKQVPACFSCHGPQGLGVGGDFPRITFQHKLYIVHQLTAWKSNQRKNDPLHLMKTVAHKLSKDEIEAVSTYLSSPKAVVSRKEEKK